MNKETGLSFPDSKYYDLYTTTNAYQYDISMSEKACNGGICFGHAMSETAGWYQDAAYYLYRQAPWILRGGFSSSGLEAGIFHTTGSSGFGASDYGFRLILTPGIAIS